MQTLIELAIELCFKHVGTIAGVASPIVLFIWNRNRNLRKQVNNNITDFESRIEQLEDIVANLSEQNKTLTEKLIKAESRLDTIEKNEISSATLAKALIDKL